MKFVFTIIALFCFSAINAASIKKPNPFFEIIVDIVEDRVHNFENSIVDWDAAASLEENVLTLVNKRLDSGASPGLDFDAIIRVFNIENFNKTKSVAENINMIVADFLDSIPFPSWIPKVAMKKQMVANLLDAMKDVQVPGFDVNKLIDENFFVWISASIAASGLDESASLKDAVNATVKNALALIKLPGFAPHKTFEENVLELVENLFKPTPFY